MLIIIEGVDGSGKSTLAQAYVDRLAEHAPTQLLHRGPLRRDPLDEYELDLQTYRPGQLQHVVCDRWHVGEDVYGPMYRSESKLDEPTRRHIEMFLLSRGAMMILMTQPLDVLVDRVGARGDEMVAASELGELQEAYYPVAMRSMLPMFHLTGEVTPDQIDETMSLGARIELACVDLTEYPTYVGPPRPQFLILGERRNDPTSQDFAAAFVPKPSTSGRYLLEHLPLDVATSCGIANAMEENVRDLWHILGHPLVVTLGRESQRRTTGMDVPHGAVPHPQYVRRFHHAHGTAYGRLIRDALLHRKDHTAWRPSS